MTLMTERSLEQALDITRNAVTEAGHELKQHYGNIGTLSKGDGSSVGGVVNAEEEAKDVWRGLAKQQDATLIIIECATSNTDLHKKRIEARVRNLHGIPEITWERVEEQRKAYTKWKEPTLKIDKPTGYR